MVLCSPFPIVFSPRLTCCRQRR
uniref:Uncharacterized protein n=1 Tax=Anguilla anguilla TaxID=7936 RepID=A0A0E9UGB7_ANGAN